MDNQDASNPSGGRNFESWIAEGFSILPNTVVRDDRLSGNAKALWAIIYDLVHFRDEQPPLPELGSLLGGGKKTAVSAMKELVDLGYVESRRRGLGMTNHYTLLPPSVQKGPEGTSRSAAGALAPFKDPLEDKDTAANAAGAELAHDPALRIYDYWRQARRKLRATYLTPSPARLKKIRTRLLEFTEVDLLRAIDGVAYDPWPDRHLHDDLTIIFRSHEQVEKFLELEARRPARAGGLTPSEIANLNLGDAAA